MTEGKITSPMMAPKEDPDATAEKVLTAEAIFLDEEPPTDGIKTAAGTVAASNGGIFSGNNRSLPIWGILTSSEIRHYGKYRKNNFFKQQRGCIQRSYVC
jgi:hypothetical protein